jgi:hypothetical protein
MRRPFDPLIRLALGAALSLPLCLGLWWWFVRGPLINLLAQGLGFVSPGLWPESVLGVGLSGDTGLLISLLPPLTDSARLFVALPVSFNRAAVILLLQQ